MGRGAYLFWFGVGCWLMSWEGEKGVEEIDGGRKGKRLAVCGFEYGKV